MRTTLVFLYKYAVGHASSPSTHSTEMQGQPKTTHSDYRVTKYEPTSRSTAASVVHRIPASGLELSPVLLTITPSLLADHIFLRHNHGGDNYDQKIDTVGHGHNPANYIGTPAALLRIVEFKSMERDGVIPNMSTLHTILSDGNILRRYQSIDHIDGGERVTRAMLGAILTHCNDKHVVDRRLIVGDEPRDGIYRGRRIELRILCNRHELLKLFYATATPTTSNLNGTLHGQYDLTRIYTIRSYSEPEILALLRSALSIGQTFHINPVQAYKHQGAGMLRGEANPSPSEKPAALIGLAHIAAMAEEKAQSLKLFWS